MGVIDYKPIWEVYEIHKGDHRNMCKNIRERWKKYVAGKGKPGQPWHGSSKIEQEYFICYEIYDTMMKNYIDISKKDNVDTNIRKRLSDSLLEAVKLTERWNDSVSNIHKTYCKGTDSEFKKKKGYKQLCMDLQAYDESFPIPAYECFAKNPRRAYDYIAERHYRPISNSTGNEPVYDRIPDAAPADIEPVFTIPPHAGPLDDAPQDNKQPVYDRFPDTTPIIIRIILQVLENALGLEINYGLIEECLSSLSDGTFDELDINPFDIFPTEYNENMGMSEEKFKMVQKLYGKYLKHRDMLQSLKPFYTVDYGKLETLLERARRKGKM